MKKLLILSGKGGTGKTTAAIAMMKLLGAEAVADCDVDAPNLHLMFSGWTSRRSRPFLGSRKALVDLSKCIGCGKCLENCRFGAVRMFDGKAMFDEYACEGCGVCEALCPVKAVELVDDIAGETTVGESGGRIFSTARLKMGRGNSGKLVMEVKKNLSERAKDSEVAVIDGSPGVGCPVIASISGVDLVLLVTEPTESGLSDLERIAETSRMFDTPIAILLNKADLSEDGRNAVIDYAERTGAALVGSIPYDRSIARSQNDGTGWDGFSECVKDAFRSALENIKKILFHGE